MHIINKYMSMNRIVFFKMLPASDACRCLWCLQQSIVVKIKLKHILCNWVVVVARHPLQCWPGTWFSTCGLPGPTLKGARCANDVKSQFNFDKGGSLTGPTTRLHLFCHVRVFILCKFHKGEGAGQQSPSTITLLGNCWQQLPSTITRPGNCWTTITPTITSNNYPQYCTGRVPGLKKEDGLFGNCYNIKYN